MQLSPKARQLLDAINSPLFQADMQRILTAEIQLCLNSSSTIDPDQLLPYHSGLTPHAENILASIYRIVWFEQIIRILAQIEPITPPQMQIVTTQLQKFSNSCLGIPQDMDFNIVRVSADFFKKVLYAFFRVRLLLTSSAALPLAAETEAQYFMEFEFLLMTNMPAIYDSLRCLLNFYKANAVDDVQKRICDEMEFGMDLTYFKVPSSSKPPFFLRMRSHNVSCGHVELNLNDMVFDKQSIDIATRLIPKLRITDLIINNTNLNLMQFPEGMTQFENMMHDPVLQANLRHLAIFGIELSQWPSAAALLLILGPNLKTLSLTFGHDSNLDDRYDLIKDFWQTLNDILPSLSQLKTLSLDECYLGALRIPYNHEFFDFLAGHAQIEQLSFANNNLKFSHLSGICILLMKSRTLRILDLSKNTIIDDRAVIDIIIPALKCSTTLESLDLSDTHIGVEGSLALLEAWQEHPSLRCLDVSRMELSVDNTIDEAEQVSAANQDPSDTAVANQEDNNPVTEDIYSILDLSSMIREISDDLTENPWKNVADAMGKFFDQKEREEKKSTPFLLSHSPLSPFILSKRSLSAFQLVESSHSVVPADCAQESLQKRQKHNTLEGQPFPTSPLTHAVLSATPSPLSAAPIANAVNNVPTHHNSGLQAQAGEDSPASQAARPSDVWSLLFRDYTCVTPPPAEAEEQHMPQHTSPK